MTVEIPSNDDALDITHICYDVFELFSESFFLDIGPASLVPPLVPDELLLYQNLYLSCPSPRVVVLFLLYQTSCTQQISMLLLANIWTTSFESLDRPTFTVHTFNFKPSLRLCARRSDPEILSTLSQFKGFWGLRAIG